MRPMTTSHADLDAPGHDGAVEHHLTDDHAHGEEPLGPVDVAAWGAGVVGILLGAAVAFCFGMATGYFG